MIDVLGILYEPGTYDEEGNELTPPTPLEGFHVNTLEPLKEFGEFLVTPKTPRRIFWNNPDTIHYRFPDEATWNQYDPRPKEEEI